MSGPRDAAPAGVAEIHDRPEWWEVTRTRSRFEGAVFSVRTDTVRMPDGEAVERDLVEHPGAVGVVALDDDDRVLLVRQYRHPPGLMMWEVPAGLRDVDGEQSWATARRELYEEAGCEAREWLTLVDYRSSPGMSDERMRVFLARGIVEVADEDRFVGEHEEKDMPVVWMPLADAVTKVLAGDIHNPTAVTGILAAYTVRADGFRDLRPADAPES
ncbi:MAG: NUDIX domain-containing protein [Streptosporangiaceae bacterium]